MRSEEEIIKSKLSTYKPAFNEGDWQAMEKMLDNKKDKKPIFIWWKYGLAIGIISLFAMGVGAYMYANKTKNTNTLTQVDAINNSSVNNNINNKVNNTSSTIQSTNSEASTEEATNDIVQNKSNISSNKQTSTKNTINNISAINKSTNNSFFSSKENSSRNISTQIPTNTTINTLENIVQDNIRSMQRNEFISFAMSSIDKINQSTEERTVCNTITDFANVKDKKHISKIPLEFSLTAQASGVINLALYQNKVNLYIDQLSDAGVLGQVMIGKRFGLYTGISYVDRLSKRNVDSSLYNDVSYTNSVVKKDKIEGVAIPIGVTVSLYKQAYVQVYTKVGVNNIIPIRQTTVVEFNNDPIPPTAPTNTQQYGNTIVSSSLDNSFASNLYETSNKTASNNSFSKVYKTKPAEKYQAELQIALGLKAKMTKNLAFTFEPAYRLGIKNKSRTDNTHGIAVSGGFVYTF
jgi:hypothetical protein